MTNVALYLRLSDEDRDKKFKTDESESIQNQKNMLREYCKERNWIIYDIYSDEDYSGADIKRPEFNRMLQDCEKGNIDIVLCKSQSRFSRDMEVVERYIHNKFIEWGVRFIGIVDHADSDDVANKKARQINGLVNEWYLEDVSENIRKTLKHKRERGEFTGSFAPYGYIVDPDNKNHLLVDEKAAAIVRSVFYWYNNGWGYRKIVIELNSNDVPNPSEYKRRSNSKYVNIAEQESSSRGLWTQSTIYRMLRNETYTGCLVQGKSHCVSYKNKKIVRLPEDEWIKVYGTHEAIIDADTWIKTQKRLKSRLRTSSTNLELSLLSGKVKCAVCGKPMYRDVYRNKNKTKSYYRLVCATYKVGAMNCTNTKGMNGRIIEQLLLDKINAYVQQYCQMDDIEIKDRSYESVEKYTADLNKLNNNILTLETKFAKLYDDRLEGVITKEQYLAFRKKYEKNLSELNERRNKVQEKIETIKSQQSDIADRKQILENYSNMTELTRDIVEEFISCVYIGEFDENGTRKVTIDWNF